MARDPPMTTDDFNLMLRQIGAGEQATPQLMEALYTQLRTMADQMMLRERGAHTLQPTALVHEAFLRLVDSNNIGDQGRVQFLGAAAVTMRRVLVDYARSRGSLKRGGQQAGERVTLSGIADDDAGSTAEDVDITTLEEALTELEQLDQQQAKVVELRFFGGMTGQQIAEHLAVSRSTVVRDLAFARAWLQRWMEKRLT